VSRSTSPLFTLSKNPHACEPPQPLRVADPRSVRESQRDSNPSAQGWRNAPTLGYVSQNVFNPEWALNGLHPFRPRRLTRSRPLARPLRAFGFAKFLSPLPKRFKSTPSEMFAFLRLHRA